MRKLKMWQRLAMIAAVLWIIGGGLWERTSDLSRAQTMMNITYSQCSDERSSKNNFDFKPCMDEAWKTHQTYMVGDWGNVAFVALAPLLVAALLAWVGLKLAGWVVAGGSVKMPWDIRGTVQPDNLPDYQPETLRRLTDYDLVHWISGYQQGTGPRIAGEVELRRRENSTARWALGISFLSLIASVVAILVKVT